MTAAFGALFVTSRVSEGINYSRGYNDPTFANAAVSRNPTMTKQWPGDKYRNPQDDSNEGLKRASAIVSAVDYNRSLMPKVAVALGGGVLLCIAYQRYQNT